MKSKIIFLTAVLLFFSVMVYLWIQMDAVNASDSLAESDSVETTLAVQENIPTPDQTFHWSKLIELGAVFAMSTRSHSSALPNSSVKTVYVGIEGRFAVDLVTKERLGTIYQFAICANINQHGVCRQFKSDGVELDASGRLIFKNLRRDGGFSK